MFKAALAILRDVEIHIKKMENETLLIARKLEEAVHLRTFMRTSIPAEELVKLDSSPPGRIETVLNSPSISDMPSPSIQGIKTHDPESADGA